MQSAKMLASHMNSPPGLVVNADVGIDATNMGINGEATMTMIGDIDVSPGDFLVATDQNYAITRTQSDAYNETEVQVMQNNSNLAINSEMMLPSNAKMETRMNTVQKISPMTIESNEFTQTCLTVDPGFGVLKI